MNRIVRIAWYGKHFGEEPPLTGDKNQGAGTIFFSGCNLHCVYCQNYQISQESLGKGYSVEDLTLMMLDLQQQGAINIDLVSPTIWWQSIKAAIISAKSQGLKIPIVWNSNAYEDSEIIKAMSGLVDIYLPDFKYGDNQLGWQYSKVKKYSAVAESAIKEMLKQVGNLRLENGIAQKGAIIRHLILPGHLPNTFSVLEKIAALDKNIHISLMGQYVPFYQAKNYSEINRRLTSQEFRAAEEKMAALELNNGWLQELDSSEIFVPDFRKSNPFI